MKLLQAIVQPNKKGQVVIPKKMRQALGITADSQLELTLVEEGIMVQPKEGGNVVVEGNRQLLKVMDRVKGAWGEALPEESEEERLAMGRELDAAQKMVKEW